MNQQGLAQNLFGYTAGANTQLNQGLGTSNLTANMPLSSTGTLNSGLSSTTSQFSAPLSTTANTQLSQPIVNTETVVIKEQPTFIQENPIINEKEIIREKPIITEKETVYCTQPIVVERPELRENLVHQVQQPTVVRDQPIFRNEGVQEVSQRPLFEGTPVVSKQTEFLREQPQVFHEKPELFQKEVITEKPIIHEKDIINIEKPVIVEKPEFIRKEFHEVQPTQRVTHDTLIHPEKQVFGAQPLREQPLVHTLPTEINQTNPVFVKENPDIFQKNIIHEKPIIHEQNILHSQKEVIHEKPELFQARIVHQEAPIVRQEPLTRTTNTNLSGGTTLNQSLKTDNVPYS